MGVQKAAGAFLKAVNKCGLIKSWEKQAWAISQACF